MAFTTESLKAPMFSKYLSSLMATSLQPEPCGMAMASILQLQIAWLRRRREGEKGGGRCGGERRFNKESL